MRGLMQDRPLTISALLPRVESNFGHKRIITGGAVETVLTWNEVAPRIRRLTRVLESLGVPAGARVGTFAWNSHRHVELYVAVPSAGRILHTINHRLFSEQITFIVNDAADDILFVDRSILPVIWPLVPSFHKVRYIVVMDDGGDMPIPDDPRILDYETLLDREADGPLDDVVTDEYAAASLCYTSGTTGNPKGVLYSHRSVVLHSLLLLGADVFALSENDVVAPIVSMFHVNAWGLPYAVMLSGSDLLLPGTAMAPKELVSLLSRHRATFSAAVATVWRSLIPMLADHDLSSLRHIACGGGAVDDALSSTYENAIGIPLTNAWGMTETSPVVTTSRLATHHAGMDREARRLLLGSPGPAVPLTEIRVVADGVEQPRDGSSQGELQVAGATIAGAYFGSDAATDAFTADGWLRTGDVATIDERGYLRIVDRTKDLVKSGGEWISSVLLENAVMSDPRVQEAAVIGVADAHWGERPLACVVPHPGVDLTAEDVRAHLRGRVASWWIPERIEMMSEIPKTATGKWSKQALRQRFADSPGDSR
ncbi:long-chain-fatty-acid--CoA ligase [Virgisporangium aliadipatigenens]|uniref:Long-chain-fatty-acid--CoA ligase n=1 Tax=Virgisporangium aliadipatigenens TaxID=741659 RepID=A0A8J4DPN7_9ACTN|nr:long-chain fatty acid--CoA ligase [Virgisporangium aliadipatigenens]GIJ46150.1 long-chain-fatty-acid--CoA ligase [Virgisporangium aliadipatigenens]